MTQPLDERERAIIEALRGAPQGMSYSVTLISEHGDRFEWIDVDSSRAQAISDMLGAPNHREVVSQQRGHGTSTTPLHDD